MTIVLNNISAAPVPSSHIVLGARNNPALIGGVAPFSSQGRTVVVRETHNLAVGGSIPSPATNFTPEKSVKNTEQRVDHRPWFNSKSLRRRVTPNSGSFSGSDESRNQSTVANVAAHISPSLPSLSTPPRPLVEDSIPATLAGMSRFLLGGVGKIAAHSGTTRASRTVVSGSVGVVQKPSIGHVTGMLESTRIAPHNTFSGYVEGHVDTRISPDAETDVPSARRQDSRNQARPAENFTPTASFQTGSAAPDGRVGARISTSTNRGVSGTYLP